MFLDFYGLNAQGIQRGAVVRRVGVPHSLTNESTVVDDPMGPGALSEAYDAEGTPKQSTVLIDRGITRTVVPRRRSGRRAKLRPPAHAWAMSRIAGAVHWTCRRATRAPVTVTT